MRIPYETRPAVEIPLPDATPVVVPVDWPDRSVITKLVVVTTAGPAEDFTVAAYNHSQVAGGPPAYDDVGPYVGPVPDDCFRVTPDLKATAGRLLHFAAWPGFVFFSQEPDPGRQGQRRRRLYLKVTPVTATPKRLAVVVGGLTQFE